jgi:hypothetical protein
VAMVADDSNDTKGSAARLLKFGLELIRPRKHLVGMGLGLGGSLPVGTETMSSGESIGCG